jgi:site-specific DNA-cytosine methylase
LNDLQSLGERLDDLDKLDAIVPNQRERIYSMTVVKDITTNAADEQNLPLSSRTRQRTRYERTSEDMTKYEYSESQPQKTP